MLLRYLSDVYKALGQNIPDVDKDDEILDIVAWLGELVRQVDSSLIDEWDSLTEASANVDDVVEKQQQARVVTENARAFAVMVRNEIFVGVKKLARRQTLGFALPTSDQEDFEELMAVYWDEFDEIDDGPAARSSDLFVFDPATGEVQQTLLDPDESGSWQLRATVDLEASNEAGKAILSARSLVRL